MTQEMSEPGGTIRPRPVRIVMIALLAAVALTLAYPMSARKSTHAGTVESAAPVAKQAEATDPQLRFSMRTVVRPVNPAEKTPSQPAERASDSAPKVEGYVTEPARR